MRPPRYGLSLFHELTGPEGPPPAPPATSGRSAALIDQRNELLFSRFYFYSRICRRQYIDALDQLTAEFFISRVMLQKILMAHQPEVLALKKQAPTVGELKKRWPHLVWEVAGFTPR